MDNIHKIHFHKSDIPKIKIHKIQPIDLKKEGIKLPKKYYPTMNSNKFIEVKFHKTIRMNRQELIEKIIPFAQKIKFSADINQNISYLIDNGWKISSKDEAIIIQIQQSILYYLNNNSKKIELDDNLQKILAFLDVSPKCSFDKIKKFILILLIILNSDFFNIKELKNINLHYIGLFMGILSYTNIHLMNFNSYNINSKFIDDCL